jgi:hypothetical protein
MTARLHLRPGQRRRQTSWRAKEPVPSLGIIPRRSSVRCR